MINLTPRQTAIAAIYGAVVWLGAALFVRQIGPLGIFDGIYGLLTYVLVIPGTIPFILIARWIAKLEDDQIATGYTVATAVALLLDGVGHSWFRSLYGTDPSLIVKGAASIFWGAGVGLILAMIMNKPPVLRG